MSPPVGAPRRTAVGTVAGPGGTEGGNGARGRAGHTGTQGAAERRAVAVRRRPNG